MLSGKTYLKQKNTNRMCQCLNDRSVYQEGDVLIYHHLDVSTLVNHSNSEKTRRQVVSQRQKQSLKVSKVFCEKENRPINFAENKEEKPNTRRMENQNTRQILFNYINLKTDPKQQSKKLQTAQTNLSQVPDYLSQIQGQIQNNKKKQKRNNRPQTINQTAKCSEPNDDQLQIEDYYSHQDFTNETDIHDSIARSRWLKKKTTKKIYNIEEFNFIRTFSINDLSESSQISLVLNTNESSGQNYSEKDYHLKKTFHPLHRYSKITRIQHD